MSLTAELQHVPLSGPLHSEQAAGGSLERGARLCCAGPNRGGDMDGSSSRFRTPEEISDAAWVESVGGTASPLLGGFALASVIVMSQSANDFRLAGAAILALTIAATAFIVALQFAQMARRAFKAREDLPISDRIVPEVQKFTEDGYAKRSVALEKARQWAQRARHTYHGGIFALLIGLALALVPRPGTGVQGILQWFAVGVGAVTCAAEILVRSKPASFRSDLQNRPAEAGSGVSPGAPS
jgi:hypothetical protein